MYDKRSLLFLLFHINCKLLKSVYHFDKVQKKGFVSFALQKPPRQINTSFKTFMSQEAVKQILKFENQLLGFFFHHQDRIYMFVRRGSDMDLLLNSNKVVHGHKPEWMILDFSLDGTQVNLCAKNTNKAVEKANIIASGYFNCECTFVNIQNKNFPLQVHKFLQACIEGSDPDICIFELNFKSDYFKNSNTYLTLSVRPYDPIAPELHILKQHNIIYSIS